MSDTCKRILVEILESDNLLNMRILSKEDKYFIADKLVGLLDSKDLSVKEILEIQRTAISFIEICLGKEDADGYRVNGKLNLVGLIDNCIDLACVSLQCKL